MLSRARLLETLNYDETTGVFRRRRNDHGGGMPIGSIVGTRMITGHIRISVDGKRYYAHQLAWLYVHGEWPDGRLDHIDNNGGNNRIDNLRIANKQQNRANAKLSGNNSVGQKGVTKLTSGRFHARLRVGGHTISLGTFNSAKEAGEAYYKAARVHFGEFAREA